MASTRSNISPFAEKGQKRPISPSLEEDSIQPPSAKALISPHLPKASYQQHSKSSSSNRSLGQKLVARNFTSPHSQSHLQSWGVPGPPDYVTTQRTRKASTPMQAYVAWENESLDSIRSGVSEVSRLKHSSVQSPTPALMLHPAPVESTSLPVTTPWQCSTPQRVQASSNNTSHGGNTSAHHEIFDTGSLDSILSQTPSSAHGTVCSHTSAPRPSIFQTLAQKSTIRHSTQPRVETKYYSLSDLKLEESSDSDSDLDFEPCSMPEPTLPKPVPWTMQDYETKQYAGISVSPKQYAHTFELSLELQTSTLWGDSYHEDNPIYSLKSYGFLETSTVDWIALYLQQLVYHSPNLETSVFITVPSRNQVLRLHPNAQPELPWLSATPPGRMLIPIVDHDAKHYYMYHVVFGELDNNPPAHFYYIDSLGRSPTEEVELKRDSFALEVVKWMLPFCREAQDWDWDTVEWHQGCPESFRQASGSLDCGLFVCQALSALAFDQCSALENMLPIDDVRSRLLWLMEQFASGTVQLGSQSSPPIWLLPLHQIPHETPSSLDNHLDCPGPLVPLEDIFSIIYERKWPLPSASWEIKHPNHGLIELESSTSPVPSIARNELEILSSPFQPLNRDTTPHTKSSSGPVQSTATPAPQTSTPSMPCPQYLFGRPRLENPFRKQKPVVKSPQGNGAPHKAMSNPFARKNKASNASSAHGSTPTSVAKPGAATPDALPVPWNALDDDFMIMPPSDEPIFPQFDNTPAGTPTEVNSPPQNISRAKVPLRQTRLVLLSPETEGGTSKLAVHRPPRAASDTSWTQHSSAMSGMTFVYGKQAPFEFPQAQNQRFAELFHDLSLPSSEHPPGFVYGTKRRNAGDIYKFTAADPQMDKSAGEEIDAGVKVYCRPDGSHDQDTTIGMSIIQFCAFIDSLQDPDDRHKAIITGTKPDGTPIVLNWLKDSLPVDRRWLAISADFDSMSITLPNPVFTIAVNITPWPDRARTLTNNVGIEISHEGKARPISHFQNFCMGLIGNNNHVRFNVFFPNYEVDRIDNKHYKTYVKSTVYALWYDEVFLGALDLLLESPPPNLHASCLQLKQELPDSYDSASSKATTPGYQGKTVKQYTVSPVIMNLLLPLMRQIVNSKLHLAFMRGYFFHIFGMNLKTAAQSIPGQEGDNPMGHTINTYPVIDFNKANPDDMVFDYGLEVLVDSRKLPDTVQHVTLLWNQAKALPIIAPNWNSPRNDAFCGSFVVGGFASEAPAQARRTGIFRTQAYPKCKNETNIHRDRSTGTSHAPVDAINNNDIFVKDMAKLKKAWKPRRSFGVRVEYRLNGFAAMVCQGVPLEQWLDNLLLGQTMVAHETQNLVRFKETMRSNYVEIIARTQALPPRIRTEISAKSMVAIVCHCIKALVKRPDDQSTTRDFVALFHMPLRALNYGYLSIHPDALCADLARVDRSKVPIEGLGIYNYFRRKGPAGARVKTSRRPIDQDSLPAISLPGPTNTGTHKPISQQHTIGSELGDGNDSSGLNRNSNWTEEDQQWLENFINKELPLCLWDLFPYRRANPDYALLQMPFSNKLWPEIARPNIGREQLVKGVNAFHNKLEKFFPEDLMTRYRAPQWKAYQTRILDKLRRRAKDRSPEDPKGYYEPLRAAIVQILAHWHFLPCPSKRAIWTYSGTGDARNYRVVSNPNVAP